MGRKASSQWEFGELFSGPELRQVLTVSQLTGNVRRLLEERIGAVWVSGEITNLRLQASGHAYFALKDPEAQLNCVLFRGVKVSGRSLLDNGQQVIVHGELTVYEPRGQYQLLVRELEFKGAGALQAAFEKLKRELDAQGYFAPARKRPLPRFPVRLGLVTSETGAAIRDVVHVIRRRHPGLEIVLAPCRVQGDGAASEIAGALRALNDWSQRQGSGRGLDLILVTRGGGSLEDLWAFNERAVADAIFASSLPVVSAVGHEIDFTISDFVADLRAATPSAAAELITEGYVGSRKSVRDALRTMTRSLRTAAASAGERFQSLQARLTRRRPSRQLYEHMQSIDDLRTRLDRMIAGRVAFARQGLAAWCARLGRIRLEAKLADARSALADGAAALIRLVRQGMKEKQARLSGVENGLRLLAPERTLQRGYSITTDEDGRIIRGVNEVSVGMRMVTRVADGRITSRMERTEPEAK